MILTSDAATILRELEVVHPAAKLLVMASQQQDGGRYESGDSLGWRVITKGRRLASHGAQNQ